jgi:sugar phosphate isomerase/epimerase
MYPCLGPGAIGIDVPFPRAAELAASAGFEGIQVDLEYLREHGPEQYNAVLDEHGLRSGSLGLPVRVDGPRDEYEAGRETLDDAARLAAAVGCERVSTYLMSFSDERPFEENFSFHRDRIEPVAELLASRGLQLGLEFLGPETLREGHEYDFVHTAEGMLDLCEAVDPDTVGLLLDSWHWYTAGSDTETLRTLSTDAVVDVHINDAPDKPRAEQTDTDRRLPAQTGVIDIEMFLGELDRTGCDGPVMVEPFSDRVEAMAPRDAVTATKDALDEAWDSAGL